MLDMTTSNPLSDLPSSHSCHLDRLLRASAPPTPGDLRSPCSNSLPSLHPSAAFADGSTRFPALLQRVGPVSLANSKPGDKGDGLRRPSAAESWEGLPKSSPAQPMVASGLEGKIWATRLVRDGCSPHSRLGVESPRWTRTMTDWRAAPTYHTTAGVIRGPRCFARLQLRRAMRIACSSAALQT